MRVLGTCVPGYGHFHPMVPVLRALQAAGHDVAFSTEQRFCARVRRAGFPAFPAGLGPGQVFERTLALPDTDPEDTARFGAQMFAGVAAPAKVPELLAIVEDWRPDLVVHDVTDFAGPLVGVRAGIPFVAHSLGPMFPVAFMRMSAELLGSPPAPATYLDICPPSLQSPGRDEIWPVIQLLRPVPFDAVAGETVPDWIPDLPARPTVHVTLGTLDNDAPGVFETVLDGLQDRDLNLVVTVGPNRDPAELGTRPPNVRIERYLPQSLLLPRCDAVVAHGGSGTMLATLAQGLPLLLLPQGANQFENAARCAEAGLGIRLLPGEITPEAVAAALGALLHDPGYRRRARAVAEEIAAMPAPEDVVPALARLAGRTG